MIENVPLSAMDASFKVSNFCLFVEFLVLALQLAHMTPQEECEVLW